MNHLFRLRQQRQITRPTCVSGGRSPVQAEGGCTPGKRDHEDLKADGLGPIDVARPAPRPRTRKPIPEAVLRRLQMSPIVISQGVWVE